MKEISIQVSNKEVVEPLLNLKESDPLRASIVEVLELIIMEMEPDTVVYDLMFDLDQPGSSAFCEVWDDFYEDVVFLRVNTYDESFE